jgi:integrase
MGGVFRPKYKDRHGKVKESAVWWIYYSQNGKQVRKSSKSTRKCDADRFLKQIEGDISRGKRPALSYEDTRFSELIELLKTDYKHKGNKSRLRVGHLKEFFGDLKAVEITTSRVKDFVNELLDEGLKPATINRELSALNRMLRLAVEDGKLDRSNLPTISKLTEANVRKHFFSHKEYVTLLEALPAYLRGPVRFAYHLGWRKSEILELTWQRVNLRQGSVELWDSKSEEPRKVFLPQTILDMLKRQKLRTPRGCEYVFHRDGEPIKDFYFAWRKATKAVGLEGRWFHDLRRCGTRNLRRAGIDRRTAMKFTGHKTESTFERYNIIDEDDMRAATAKLDEFNEVNGA